MLLSNGNGNKKPDINSIVHKYFAETDLTLYVNSFCSDYFLACEYGELKGSYYLQFIPLHYLLCDLKYSYNNGV